MEDNETEFEIEIDEELYAQVEKFAKADGVTIEEWISAAIKKYFEKMTKEEDN